MRLRFLIPFLVLGACDCGDPMGPECVTSSDCLRDEDMCIDGTCIAAATPDASLDVGAPDGDGPDSGTADVGLDAPVCEMPCGEDCCDEGEMCSEAMICVTDEGECESTDDCVNDSRCLDGRCISFGDGETDPTCNRTLVAGSFSPTVQCAFDATPEGDAFPAHLHVLSTPMVVDLRVGAGPDDPPRPSIIATFDDGSDGGNEQATGVIRILDGATCEQQAELGSLQITSHSSPPAVGDIDGDGRPEIIAMVAGGGLVAFHNDAGTGEWEILWRSTLEGGAADTTGGSGWTGPTIVDLNDDGVPEILRSGFVYDADGVQIDNSLGNIPGRGAVGVFPVVVDVDDDGMAEHVQGHGVWEWDPETTSFVAEEYSAGGTAPGHVAIGDFGDFPGAAEWPAETPEVAVVSSGQVRVQTLDGTIVFGPVPIFGGGSGGPPTIADFDNDGRAEFGTAGANNYNVFDLDCGMGECANAENPLVSPGILWERRSQDASSNVTGSSVFDFEGDGRAEVVYGDECFVRVYDGETGTVVFSQSRSSCTWYENPVVADLDGDFNAEIVIGDNFNCGSADTGRDCTPFGLDAQSTDPIFPGLRCSENTDCVSGNCVEGLCRCTTDDECCVGAGCEAAAFVCEVPPEGTPGEGNTCRASRPVGTRGIRVFRDASDRWVSSRRIWNQHAYHVTNVNEDGTIPSTSEAALNWLDPDLNNFRQNVQGTTRRDSAPDATSRTTPVECGVDGAILRSVVCNRGTEPLGAGLPVGYYLDEVVEENRVCRTETTRVLEPGECEPLRCTWADAPSTEPGADLLVVADDGGDNGECHESNNTSTMLGVFCERVE